MEKSFFNKDRNENLILIFSSYNEAIGYLILPMTVFIRFNYSNKFT
jgi:hypothetical protein